MDGINSINAMLIEVVREGGWRKQGRGAAAPEKPVLDAQKLLLNCLNDDRPEKLSPDQAFFIENLAKRAGSHVAIEFRCRAMSYTIPTPIQPRDEAAQLQREFIEASRAMTDMMQRMEYLCGQIKNGDKQ